MMKLWIYKNHIRELRSEENQQTKKQTRSLLKILFLKFKKYVPLVAVLTGVHSNEKVQHIVQL